LSLSGKRIVITRAPHQAEELASLLRQHNAEPLLYPCIEIVPPEDTTPLDQALHKLENFDWLLLTSGNTVYALESRLGALGITLPASLKIAAVGSSTAKEAFKAFGIEPQVLPDEHTSDALADILAHNLKVGTRFLLPQSEIARPTLTAKLRAAGGDVTVITAYRTVTGKDGVDLPAMLKQRMVDAVTFTSSSTVEQFFIRTADGFNKGLKSLVDDQIIDLLKPVYIACIGTVTAETARQSGLNNIIVPQVFTLAGMISALEEHFSGENP
jgi:uroporphyrinogen-III synthase